MPNHKILLAGAMVASFAGMSLPSYADIYVSIDPPANRVEHFEPRSGYAVVPGVWEYRNGKHEWVGGHYVAARKGYHYEGDRWVQRHGNQWTMQHGGWARDSDGDGVPNRSDGHPSDPRRQ
jgi:hypothetical protein